MGMILNTKLQRVTLAQDVIPRTRLLDQLEYGINLPLSLLSAPAGYGKSTLAGQWAAITKSPCSWLSLDEEHNDLHLLLNYIIVAVKHSCPDITLHTQTLLEADPLPSAGELASYLLNDLHLLPRRIILILDDYHRISRQRVHLFFTSLVTQASPNLHLAFVSRKDPPFPVATMRAKGMLTEIRAKDLRFTAKEITDFLNGMLNRPIDDRTAELLAQKTEGWGVGIRLTGLYLKGQNNLEKLVKGLNGNARYIADYLFSEIISRLDPKMLSRLGELSILDRFCASIGDHIHQGDDSLSSTEQCIEQLLQSNIFIIPLDNNDIWFRFHHLFRDYLKGLLRKQKSAEQINSLHQLAGKWFAGNELIEEASHHLLAAENYPEAIQLVLSHRHGLMNNSQFTRLSRWLAKFPEQTLAQEPLLMTTGALVSADLGKNIDIYAFTEKANQVLADRAPESDRYFELKGEVLVLQSLLALINHDVQNAFSLVTEALDCLCDNALLAKTFGIFTLSVCHQMTGNSRKAAAIIKEVASSQAAQVNIQARMQMCLCYVYYMDANPGKVEKAAQRSLRTIGDLPFFHTRAYGYYFHGVALYMQNRLGPAEARLRTIFDDPYSANPTYLAHTGFILACIYLSRGEESRAAHVLAQLEEHFRDNGHARAMDLIRAFEAEFAYRCGDITKAIRISRQIDFDVNHPRWFFYIPQLTPIKCLLAKGTKQGVKEAHTRLTDLDERMRQINRINVRIETLILLALVCQKQRKNSEAKASLLSALDLACAGNWIRSFLDAKEPVVSLLQQIAQDGKQQAFVQKILHAFSQESPQAPSSLQPFSKTTSLPSPLLKDLTRRETEILPLLAEGLSNKEIAARLSVSDLTVKSHLQNIYSKLGVKGRVEAVNKSGILRSSSNSSSPAPYGVEE